MRDAVEHEGFSDFVWYVLAQPPVDLQCQQAFNHIEMKFATSCARGREKGRAAEREREGRLNRACRMPFTRRS